MCQLGTLNHLIFGTSSGKSMVANLMCVNLARLHTFWSNSSVDITVKVFFRYNEHLNQWTFE